MKNVLTILVLIVVSVNAFGIESRDNSTNEPARKPVNSHNLCSRVAETRIDLVDEAITEAAEKGDIAVLKKAFARGVSPNATTYEGFSLLHIAITENQNEALKFLIKQGADVNQTFNGTSPLGLVWLSIPAGTIDHRDEFLLKKGAKFSDLDIAEQTVQRYGYKSLSDGFIDSITKGNMERLEWYVRATYDINAPLSGEMRPLQAAAFNGTPDAVRYLIECGADVKVRSKKGTPLLWFAKDRPDVAAVLRSYGAPEVD